MKNLLKVTVLGILYAGAIALVTVPFTTTPVYSAISVSTAWEVRPTVGASTNGGGFVQGATGTDMSVFNNKNAAGCTSCQSTSVNISTTDGVAVGSTTYTSVTGNFSTAIVGNVIYLQGGTGSIAAVRRQVTARASTTSITLDASVAASTGMTMNIGGSLDDIATALLANTAGNIIFVKDTGTLVRTATLTLNNNLQPQPTAPANRIIGYVTTRNEAPSASKRAHLQLSTNTGLSAFSGNVSGWWIQNMDIDCNNLGTSTGIIPWVYWVIVNNKVSNCRSIHIGQSANLGVMIADNEIVGNGNSCTSGIDAASGIGSIVVRNYVHGLACVGINFSTGAAILYNIVSSGTGATTDGYAGNSTASTIIGNIAYSNGRCGFNMNANGPTQPTHTRNNILYGNTSFGWCNSTAGTPAMPMWDGNAYGANSGGTRQNMDDVGGTNPINGAAAYTNTLDVILSADPFTNAAAGDFSLNTTTGGGASLKATGTPGTLPGLSTTGYMDFGVFQVQAPTGGGNSAYAQ